MNINTDIADMVQELINHSYQIIRSQIDSNTLSEYMNKNEILFQDGTINLNDLIDQEDLDKIYKYQEKTENLKRKRIQESKKANKQQ